MGKPPDSWTVYTAILVFGVIALGSVFHKDDGPEHTATNRSTPEARKVKTITVPGNPGAPSSRHLAGSARALTANNQPENSSSARP